MKINFLKSVTFCLFMLIFSATCVFASSNNSDENEFKRKFLFAVKGNDLEQMSNMLENAADIEEHKKMNLINAGILRGLAYDYEKLEMLSNTVITKKEEELEEFSALDFFALIPKLLKF